MSILNRLNRIIRSNVNDLKNTGQSGSIDRALGEMETSLKDARRQKAMLRQQEKKIVAAIRQSRDKADQWEDRAMMALQKSEEDLAKDALIVRNEALERASELREELEEHRMYLQDIESALEALEMKLDGTRGRLRASSSGRRSTDTKATRTRSTRRGESDWDAEFRRRVGERGAQTPEPRSNPTQRTSSKSYAAKRSSFDDDHLFDEVDRMGSKINAFEAEVEAQQELSGDNLSDPGLSKLEERFRTLEDREQMDHARDKRDKLDDGDDLSDLKKKFEE
jgi:phage shock protein A